MNEFDIINTIMKDNDISSAMLARRLDMSRQALYARIRATKSLSIESFSEILKALGYEMVIVKDGETRLPKDHFVLDRKNSEEN